MLFKITLDPFCRLFIKIYYYNVFIKITSRSYITLRFINFISNYLHYHSYCFTIIFHLYFKNYSNLHFYEFFYTIGLYVIRSRILTFTLPVSYFTLILTFFINIFQILHQDLNTFLYIITIFFKLDKDLKFNLYIIIIFL